MRSRRVLPKSHPDMQAKIRARYHAKRVPKRENTTHKYHKYRFVAFEEGE